MLKAVDLLRQGRTDELWQMCCGFLSLNIDQFMVIQEQLLLKQLNLLNRCKIGRKIMGKTEPATVEQFRKQVPLTSYSNYCPELVEKQEDILPEKPYLWAHSAGRSDAYPCKWVPMTYDYAWELSKILYGIGMISCSSDWGDVSSIPNKINILYSVAPTPYISGTFAELLRMQSPLNYLPSIEESKDMSFEDRISLGFKQAMSQGFDYFFGLSMVLANVGEKIRDSSNNIDIRPFLKSPRALWRLSKGKVKSYLTGRPMLPKDLWKIKGIIGSGTDSFIFKNKIKELWGRSPLDLYACTEGGIIATQAWDYAGLTFVPNLNFLEFISEDEQLKWQMDSSYQPKTLLLNEVKAGENYEIVVTNFHGGALVRYRIGDMVRIVSLRDDKLGINIPQMSFERRVDDFIDFYVVNFSERSIWKAIESAGVAYEDWIAYKDAETMSLNIGIELKENTHANAVKIASLVYNYLTQPDTNKSPEVSRNNDLTDTSDFQIKLELLPRGTFSSFIARKQAEGADLAHLKPPHVNPSEKILSLLTYLKEDIIVVNRSGAQTEEKSGKEKAIVI